MEYIENRTYDEIRIGDTASLVRTLKLEDIQLFAAMSGDINPFHLDPSKRVASRARRNSRLCRIPDSRRG